MFVRLQGQCKEGTLTSLEKGIDGWFFILVRTLWHVVIHVPRATCRCSLRVVCVFLFDQHVEVHVQPVESLSLHGSYTVPSSLNVFCSAREIIIRHVYVHAWGRVSSICCSHVYPAWLAGYPFTLPITSSER